MDKNGGGVETGRGGGDSWGGGVVGRKDRKQYLNNYKIEKYLIKNTFIIKNNNKSH